MHIKRDQDQGKKLELSYLDLKYIQLTTNWQYISFLNRTQTGTLGYLLFNRFELFFPSFKSPPLTIHNHISQQKNWNFSNRGSIPILNCAHTLCKSLHWEHDEAPQQFLMPSIAVSEEWLASNGTLLNVHPRLNANLIAPARNINSILLNAEDLFAARQGHVRTRFTSKYKRYHNNAI